MKFRRLVICAFVVAPLLLSSFFQVSIANAANLTLVKDTLQTSRMSFNGRVKAPTIAGSSHVWIYGTTSGLATSITTAGLKPGDSVVIGGTNSYVIDSIINDLEFTTSTVLTGGDAADGATIWFKSRPQQVVTFTTDSAVSGGFFRILVQAETSASNDAIPGITGFDFNSVSTLTASPAAGYTFVAGVATASGGSGCTSPANFHCFEFHYTGPGAAGTPLSFSIGTTAGASMIAPAPSASRVASQADTYTYTVQAFPNGSDPNVAVPTDVGSGKVGVIESVRVTATVDPAITFKIEGTSAGTSACSITSDVTTTSSSVPFGVLALDTFKTGVQKITISTNAVTGYAVTAVENERLSNLAGSPSYIPDTTCDTGTCTQTTSAAWATAAAHPGFGYTVAILSGTPTIAPTSPNYQHFPNLAAIEAPFQIMSNATIASSQQIYVCYKISVDATQPAGNYENQVTYTATASF